MKRNRIILIAVAVFACLAIYFILKSTGSSTIKKDKRDFAIVDTASIDKIFMVEKDLDQVTLTRDDGNWIVNGKHLVRPDAINVLLKTFHRMRVKAPVSKAAFDNVVTMLATRNTKVEVFKKDRLIKTLYVGGPTQDQMGTYMMLDGSASPFVVHIPGFVGYLSPRFFTRELDWRSTLIFHYDFSDIQSVELLNHERPGESFIINRLTSGNYDIYNLTTNEKPIAIDTVSINFYISYYEKINCETFADYLSDPILDSLQTAQPFRTITVRDNDGMEKKVEAFRRYANGKTDPEGNPLIWDDERMYGRINNEDWVIIQYWVFDKLFLDFSVFNTEFQ